MEAGILVPLTLAAITGLALGYGEWRSYQRRIERWQSLRIGFGRNVSLDAAEATLRAISGLPRGRVVALEVLADSAGIEHRLCSDQATLDSLRAQLRAVIPSLRLDRVTNEAGRAWSSGLVIRSVPAESVLWTDAPDEAATALLGTLQPLGANERLMVRWLVSPGRAEAISDPVEPAEGQRPPARQRITNDHRRLLRVKNAGPIVRAQGLVAVEASPIGRQRHLLGRVAAVVRARGTAYGRLRMRMRTGSRLRRTADTCFLLFGDRYAPAELAGLVSWPIGGVPVAGVTLGTSPVLMPSSELPRQGRIVGRATWPGGERIIAEPLIGALSHALVTGPTGTGKSALLTNWILSDVTAGNGTILIDGKGDTYEAALARLPAERHKDVIVLDCASSGPVPGLKLLAGDAPQLTADVVLGVLSDLFRDSWGPLSERYLRAALVAVAHDPKGTLADLPYVYSDPGYRRRLVGRLQDPLVEATFAALDAMKPAERLHQLSAPLNKLGIILGRPTVRAFVGQQEPELDFRRVLAGRRIVVINLNPSRIGAPASRLIGALTIYALFQATLDRRRVAADRRRPFFVYLDEPKSLGDLPMPLDTLFEQARGLGVGLTLAPQSIAQLPQRVREAVMTNVATRVIFRSHADDARLLARDLPGVEPGDLGDLGQFEAIARIGLGPGSIAPPVSLRTPAPSKPTADGLALAAEAASRHGRLASDVDEELRARHTPAGADTAIGRKRRSA